MPYRDCPREDVVHWGPGPRLSIHKWRDSVRGRRGRTADFYITDPHYRDTFIITPSNNNSRYRENLGQDFYSFTERRNVLFIPSGSRLNLLPYSNIILQFSWFRFLEWWCQRGLAYSVYCHYPDPLSIILNTISPRRNLRQESKVGKKNPDWVSCDLIKLNSPKVCIWQQFCVINY